MRRRSAHQRLLADKQRLLKNNIHLPMVENTGHMWATLQGMFRICPTITNTIFFLLHPLESQLSAKKGSSNKPSRIQAS